jgi:channel protein (hemolysin III family)
LRVHFAGRLVTCLALFLYPLAMRVLQILDHVGIYLVIVGTMTPFMLVGLHHHNSARVLICAEWIAAFLGCLFAGKSAVEVVCV